MLNSKKNGESNWKRERQCVGDVERKRDIKSFKAGCELFIN